MKKIIIFTSLCFASALICAQNSIDRKGEILLNGNIGFSYDKSSSNINNSSINENITRKIIGLNPKVGYFVTEKIAFGVGLEYLYNNISSDNSVLKKQVLNTVLLTPFVRYYTNLDFFGQFQIGMGGSNSWQELASSNNLFPSSIDLKYNTFQYSFGLGYSYYLANNIAIEPLIDYVLLYNYKGDKRVNKSNIIQLSVGLQFYL